MDGNQSGYSYQRGTGGGSHTHHYEVIPYIGHSLTIVSCQSLIGIPRHGTQLRFWAIVAPGMRVYMSPFKAISQQRYFRGGRSNPCPIPRARHDASGYSTLTMAASLWMRSSMSLSAMRVEDVRERCNPGAQDGREHLHKPQVIPVQDALASEYPLDDRGDTWSAQSGVTARPA